MSDKRADSNAAASTTGFVVDDPFGPHSAAIKSEPTPERVAEAASSESTPKRARRRSTNGRASSTTTTTRTRQRSSTSKRARAHSTTSATSVLEHASAEAADDDVSASESDSLYRHGVARDRNVHETSAELKTFKSDVDATIARARTGNARPLLVAQERVGVCSSTMAHVAGSRRRRRRCRRRTQRQVGHCKIVVIFVVVTFACAACRHVVRESMIDERHARRVCSLVADTRVLVARRSVGASSFIRCDARVHVVDDERPRKCTRRRVCMTSA